MTRHSSRGIGFLFVLLVTGTCGVARVFSTLEQGIETSFTGADIRREVIFPTAEEVARAAERAGVEIPEAPVYRYLVFQEDVLVGYAYPDRHRVRTLPETLLLLVSPEGHLREVQVLAFSEPQEYLPNKRWYAQFEAVGLNDELRMHRGIDGVTGATLTARATTQAARRVLALHQVLQLRPSP